MELCLGAIDAGWEDRYPPDRLAFVYMPLMHAESRAMQDLSVAKFAELGRTRAELASAEAGELEQRFLQQLEIELTKTSAFFQSLQT